MDGSLLRPNLVHTQCQSRTCVALYRTPYVEITGKRRRRTFSINLGSGGVCNSAMLTARKRFWIVLHQLLSAYDCNPTIAQELQAAHNFLDAHNCNSPPLTGNLVPRNWRWGIEPLLSNSIFNTTLIMQWSFPNGVIPCQICMKILDPFKNVIFVSYHHN